MGFSKALFFFPVLMMMVSIVMQGGTLQGANANAVICNPNSVVCNNSATGSTTFGCAPGVSVAGVSIFSLVGAPCSLPGPCPSSAFQTASNTFCALDGKWLTPYGTTVTIPNSLLFNKPTTSGGPNTQNGVFFGFGNIGAGGFIAIIGIAIGITALAGVTIFGTGSSFEAVHILFIGGMLLAVWTVLSGIEGFVGGNATSLFTELNKPYISVEGIPFGTSFYVLITFMYMVNFILLVKRGD